MPALPITDLSTAHLSVSTGRLGFQKPLGNAVKALPSLDYVTVRLKAGDLEGPGYAFTPGHGTRARTSSGSAPWHHWWGPRGG